MTSEARFGLSLFHSIESAQQLLSQKHFFDLRSYSGKMLSLRLLIQPPVGPSGHLNGPLLNSTKNYITLFWSSMYVAPEKHSLKTRDGVDGAGCVVLGLRGWES